MRLFQSQVRTVKQVIAIIQEVVKYKLMGMKLKHNLKVFQILTVWNISIELPSIQPNAIVSSN